MNVMFVIENQDIINGDGDANILFSCENVIVNTLPYFFFSTAALINIIRW